MRTGSPSAAERAYNAGMMNYRGEPREVSLKELGMDYFTTRSDESFRKLYERVKPGLENHLFKMTRDRDMAGHLLSQTMTTVHEKIEQYNPKWHISTWIYRIAFVNFCLNLRQEKRRGMSYIADVTEGPGATHYRQTEYAQALREQSTEEDADTVKSRRLDRLPDCVDTLPEDLKSIVQAKYYEGLSLKQIAARSGVAEGIVRVSLNKAKRIMKMQLAEVV